MPTLSELRSSILPLGPSWSDQIPTDKDPIEQIKLCKIASQPSTSVVDIQPLVVSHSLIVHADLSWQAFVHDREVVPTATNPLSGFPKHLDVATLKRLILVIETSTVCPGNPDAHFVEMGSSNKGKFVSTNGEVRAVIESRYPLSLNGIMYTSTVRTSCCEMLVHGAKCTSCRDYRSQLQAMRSRLTRKAASVHKYTNNRFLNTPQKDKKN